MRNLHAGTVVMLAGVLALAVYLFWPWLAAAGLVAFVTRRLLRRERERRPRSSWAQLLEAGSALVLALKGGGRRE